MVLLPERQRRAAWTGDVGGGTAASPPPLGLPLTLTLLLEIFGIWLGGFMLPLLFVASTSLWLGANLENKTQLVGGSVWD